MFSISSRGMSLCLNTNNDPCNTSSSFLIKRPPEIEKIKREKEKKKCGEELQASEARLNHTEA